MKQVLAILLIIAAVWGIRELVGYWDKVKRDKETQDRGGAPAPTTQHSAPGVLPGLPPSLESNLQASKKQGAGALKTWLKNYRSYVADPRLADIELDYVILLGSSNLPEARQVFSAVKQRTPTNSPVYPRIKKLESTYQ